MFLNIIYSIRLEDIILAYKGHFTPKNKDKYKGDITNITYRSMWERKVMRWMDESPSVICWSSEEVVIPYVGPDGKKHRYFTDFYAEITQTDGSLKTMVIEVKPYSQTIKPVPRKDGKRTRRTYINEMNYMKNLAKWEAAKNYCEERGWYFQILTEKELGLKNKGHK